MTSVEDFMQHWEWAWMNLSTRCFGHYHFPHELAMIPLMDLCNHTEDQENVRFFLIPASLNSQMLNLDSSRQTNIEIEKDTYETYFLGTTQQEEEGTLAQDSNQHTDYYPDKYYNYRPLKIIDKRCYPPKTEKSINVPSPLMSGVQPAEFWEDEKGVELTPISEIWPLSDPQVAFGLMLASKF